jgi:hypothetical protein
MMMKMKTLSGALLAIALVSSSVGNSLACNVLSYFPLGTRKFSKRRAGQTSVEK